MYEEVCGERGGPLEGFAALLTAECLLLCVHRPVLGQAHRVAKSLGTDITLIRALATVRPPDMDFQPVRRAKLLQTLHTLI